MNKIKNTLRNHYINAFGWRTNRKIVVIESDDWGSIRTPSNEALEFCRKNGVKVDNCHFMLYDSLASDDDLQYLFEVLKGFEDKNGNNPIMTCNVIVANPDFEKIKSNNFSQYYYEPFTTTLQKYPKHSRAFGLWKKGMEEGVFYPQFHGREHLNISRWLKDLRKGVDETIGAFNYEMFGISGHVSKVNRGSYLSAFDGEKRETLFDHSGIVKEGIQIFKDIFEFTPKSFCAPNYIWGNQVEKELANQEVNLIQGTYTQKYPADFGTKRQLKRHYLGKKNQNKQYYLLRNVNFEPSKDIEKDWVDKCLKEIEIAFKWKKPATISTHRVNFVGYLNERNRDRNLVKLNRLLSEIFKKWPEVEFMTSVQLGKLILQDEQK